MCYSKKQLKDAMANARAEEALARVTHNGAKVRLFKCIRIVVPATLFEDEDEIIIRIGVDGSVTQEEA